MESFIRETEEKAKNKPKPKASELKALLPTMNEPLRSTLARSSMATSFPENWLLVSLQMQYADADREFANLLKEKDIELFKAIVIADINLLLRDPKISTTQIRQFARVEHCLSGSAIKDLLELKSLGDFLAFVNEISPRTTNGCFIYATMKDMPKGLEYIKFIVMPHCMPAADIRGQIPETDSYFQAYWKHLEAQGYKNKTEHHAIQEETEGSKENLLESEE